MTDAAARPRAWRHRPWLLLIPTALGVATALWAWQSLARTSPETLLRDAVACAVTDPAAAISLSRRAIVAAGGKYPEAERTLCLISARRGDWTTATATYAGLDPAACPPEFLMEFGQLSHGHGGDEATGIAALIEVRRRRIPASFSALDVLYSIHRAHDRPREMLDCAREMALLHPRRPELWWKVLELLDTRGLTPEFLDTLRLALQQELPEPILLEMRHRLIERLIDGGDAPAAREELARLPDDALPSGRAMLHEARLLRLQGQPEKSLDIASGIDESSVAEIDLLRLRSMLFLDLHRDDDAIADLLRLVELDFYELTFHFKLAEAYRRLGRTEAALEHDAIVQDIRDKRRRIHRLRETAKQHPENGKLYEELAALHRALNDSAGATLWEKRAQDVARAQEKP